MSTPWFAAVERQQALWDLAKQWEGTPFFAHAESLGYGVDCVRLGHALWSGLGAMPRLELPVYTLDRGKHTPRSQLLRFLLEQPALEGRLMFVPPGGKIMAGDLHGLRSGYLDHHLAMALPWGKVVHAVEDRGVIIHDIAEESFRTRVLYVLRLLEAPQP